MGWTGAIGRTLLAAILGIAAGATVAALEFVVLSIVDRSIQNDLATVILVWAVAFATIAIGFVCLGIPAWLVAHLLHRRHWYDALLIGALLAGGLEFYFQLPAAHSNFTVGNVFLAVGGRFTHAGLMNALGATAMAALMGAAAGLTIWRVAYRGN